MSKLIKAYQQELGAGVTPSLPELRAPFWVNATDVRFGLDGVEVVEPWVRLFAGLYSQPVRGIFAHRISGTSWLFWGSSEWLFRWDGAATVPDEAIASVLAGGKTEQDSSGPATVWTFAAIGTTVLASDGERAIKESVAAADFADLTGSNIPGTASIIRSIRNFAVAFGTDVGPNVFEWSDQADHTNWVISSASSAGLIEMYDARGDIKAVEHLGASMALIYCEGSIHQLYDAGSSLVFGQRKVLDGFGAASKQAVIPVGNQHFVFDQTGIYVTDGVSAQYIDDPTIRRHILDILDTEKLSHVSGFFHRTKDELQWYFPTTTSVKSACVTYRRANGSWGLLDAPMTSGIASGVFKGPIAGNRFGEVYQLQEGTIGGGGGDVQGDALANTATAEVHQGYGAEGYGAMGYGGISIDG